MLENLFRKYQPNFRKRNVDLTKIPELNENGESNTLPTEAKDDNSDRKFFSLLDVFFTFFLYTFVIEFCGKDHF